MFHENLLGFVSPHTRARNPLFKAILLDLLSWGICGILENGKENEAKCCIIQSYAEIAFCLTMTLFGRNGLYCKPSILRNEM